MPLLSTSHTPRAGRTRLTAPQRAQRVRQFAALLAGGAPPGDALSACGLTWRTLWLWCERDASGELAAILDRARAFGAHAVAAAQVAVADEPVADLAGAARARNRITARQWLAARWNPAAYGAKPAEPAPPAVVHHVVHLPARGPAPDPAALPVAGELVAIEPARRGAIGSGAPAPVAIPAVEAHAPR